MDRRGFLKASTAGLAAATIPAAGGGRAAENSVSQGPLGNLRSATPVGSAKPGRRRPAATHSPARRCRAEPRPARGRF